MHDGIYREIQPVSRLVLTWTCVELGVADSLVTIELAARGSLTELVLPHELPDDPIAVREHEKGWNGCLDILARFLDSGGERQCY